ncbi:hypothetical protein XENTR_v10003157 [Xenopus tropicalis]|nr:hypothetical protein XENTR_v10003157 [Xenopus tropicalis]
MVTGQNFAAADKAFRVTPSYKVTGRHANPSVIKKAFLLCILNYNSQHSHLATVFTADRLLCLLKHLI